MSNIFDPLSPLKELAKAYLAKNANTFKEENEGLSPVERLSALASGSTSEKLKDNYYNDVANEVPNAMGTVAPVTKDPLNFFSKLRETIKNKMGNTASPEQVRGMLREVKPEEMK